jgi:hypothetical protein
VGSTNPSRHMTVYSWVQLCSCCVKDLGVLGTTEVQNVHVAGDTQKVLDLGPPSTTWFASSRKMSTL